MGDVRLMYGPFDGHRQDYGIIETIGHWPKSACFRRCDLPRCDCGGQGVRISVARERRMDPEWLEYLLDHVDAGCGVYRYGEIDAPDGQRSTATGIKRPIRSPVRDREIVPA